MIYAKHQKKRVLSTNEIKDAVSFIINNKYKDSVDFIYLYGSYAKGYTKEKSDTDLCILLKIILIKKWK